MRYAVVYQSDSGNTREIAEEIYESLCSDDKEIYDLNWNLDMPEADFYFIGFGVRNGGCSLDIKNCFDQITDGQYALFATCGFAPTEQYRKELEKKLELWMPEEAVYFGMFLCQGRVGVSQQAAMLEEVAKTAPDEVNEVTRMFVKGYVHPDTEDLRAAGDFVRDIQRAIEQ